MFSSIRNKLRKMRRRRSMRLRRGRGPRSASRMRASRLGPIMIIGSLAVLAAGFITVIVLVIVPLFGAGNGDLDPVTASVAPEPSLPPIAREDMSDLAKELGIVHKSINDPYIFENEVAFSTGNQLQASPSLDTIAVYDIALNETSVVEEITKKYDFLFEPKINSKYIVYLDCKNEYGGAVCGYDRESKKAFVMREYLYGKPKVSVSGDYALWSQQTGRNKDRLYLYHLPTHESVEIEIFDNTFFSVSAPFMSDNFIIFVQPYGESQVLDGSSASIEPEICVIPLREGGDNQKVLFRPGTDNVYDPMISGSNIVFIDTNRDHDSRLLLCARDGNDYSEPKVIAQGVVNYCVGDGFVVYTKDEAIYIYYFKDGSSGRLSSENTRALLAGANGKKVVWYDITELGVANVVFYAQVP
ncbi:MAG: hypothetical protein WDA65_00435 [Christensenellales bacterium]